jgi:diguanylate cyclase (GGDEF)-like protein
VALGTPDYTRRLVKLAGMNSFRAGLIALVVVFVAAVFTGIYLRTDQLINDSLRWQGRAYFALVIDVRTWSAEHHGVFVVSNSASSGRIQSDARTMLALYGVTPQGGPAPAATGSQTAPAETPEPVPSHTVRQTEPATTGQPEPTPTQSGTPQPTSSETSPPQPSQTETSGLRPTPIETVPPPEPTPTAPPTSTPTATLTPRPSASPGSYLPPVLPPGAGKGLTWLNPYVVLGELAQVSSQSSGVSFHLTSLTPIDRANLPDAWERSALLSFERGATEAAARQTVGGRQVYRYMAPVYTLSSCRQCHGAVAYKVGSVRGAVSVDIPVAAVRHEAHVNLVLVATLGGLTLVAGLLALWLLVFKVTRRLRGAQANLAHLALHDPLTGVANRRQTMDRLAEELARAKRAGTPLSVVIIDLDHFKAINDQHGHPFGDVVLQGVVRRVQQAVRSYDVLGRFGGEEFLVVAPATAFADALTLAERIRVAVGAAPMGDEKASVTISVSAGVAQVREDDGCGRVDRSRGRRPVSRQRGGP